jgi:hypothetical protein
MSPTRYITNGGYGAVGGYIAISRFITVSKFFTNSAIRDVDESVYTDRFVNIVGGINISGFVDIILYT